MARKSKQDASVATAPAEDEAAAAPEPEAAAPAPAPAPVAAASPVHGAGETSSDQFSVNHYLDLGDLFTTPRNATAEERDRVAAAEFQAAIAPAFAGKDGPPPAASTPDEAVREFVEAAGPALPDPGGNIAGSIYNDETAAYYRIRRHFLKGVGRMAPGWTPPPGLGPPT